MERTAIPAPSILTIQPESDDDDSPGLIDKLADTERAFPNWNETVIKIGEKIEAIGALMQDATSEIARGDARGKGFAARLTVARKLATDLEEPTNETQDLANKFAAQLNEIDPGVRAILEHAPDEVKEILIQPRFSSA